MEAIRLEERRRTAVPLYVEIAGLLRQQIVSGERAPGERLPTLAELRDGLGVSRVTVRQAMDVLESEGLIDRSAGRGTFVRPTLAPRRERLKLTASLASLIDMMRDGTATPLTTETRVVDALPGPFPAHRLAEGTCFRAMRRVHAKDDEPFSVVDLYLREDVYERAPERFEKRIAITVMDDLGVRIAGARQTISVSSADVQTASQLDVPVNSPLMLVHRVFEGADGTVIYAAAIRYRSDFIAFDIEFS